MAAKNVNTVQRRFEDGHIVTIGNGTDVLTVFNIMEGSFKRSAPKREHLYHTDNGVQQPPIMGNDELGDLEFTMKGGKDTGDELMTTLNEIPANTNQAKEFTVTVKIPDYRGATTGEVFTTTNASLAAQLMRQAGRDFDTIPVKMKYRTLTLATY